MSYKELEKMEYKKANARYEFLMDYKQSIDLVKDQVQRNYDRIRKDYVDNVLKIKNSVKLSYNKAMNTIDNFVDKYKKKELQPVYLK